MADHLHLPVYAANRIGDDSWLNRPKYERFRNAYAYASTQTYAIPALSKCEPEEVFHAVSLILRGAGLYDAQRVLDGETSASPAGDAVEAREG